MLPPQAKPASWIGRAAMHLGRILLTIVLGTFLGATLVRLAPGFGVDERELDIRFRATSIHAIRQSNAGAFNMAMFYFTYLKGVARGDLGTSRSLNRPIRELFAQRAPVTFLSIAIG